MVNHIEKVFSRAEQSNDRRRAWLCLKSSIDERSVAKQFLRRVAAIGI
jgi:hypothetical protein